MITIGILFTVASVGGGCIFDPQPLFDKSCGGEHGGCAANEICHDGYCSTDPCLELADIGKVCGTCDSGTWECQRQLPKDGFASATAICAGDEGEAARNACGGCDDLPEEVGSPCDAGCAEGMPVYECNGTDAVKCSLNFVEANACLDCRELPQGFSPGGACGTCGTWSCETEACEGDHGTNTCGGCDDLPENFVLGDICDPGNSCGRWGCDEMGGADCPIIPVNDCGGCNALPPEFDLDGDCGTCGTWVCSQEQGFCQDPGANACGGCGDLPEDFDAGQPCNECGTWACNDDNEGFCDEPENCDVDCEDDDRHGEICGACDEGEFACVDDEITCVGDPGQNACGSCIPLPPGFNLNGQCQQCGTFICEEGIGTCDDPGFNACGGCGAEPEDFDEGEPCGLCGTWTCVGNTPQCNDPGRNACNGCGQEPEEFTELNQPCGTCGTWACSDELVPECQGDTPNPCGGCGELPEGFDEGEPCNECGTWACNDEDNSGFCDEPEMCPDLCEEDPRFEQDCGPCLRGTFECVNDEITCVGEEGLSPCGDCAPLPDDFVLDGACGDCGAFLCFTDQDGGDCVDPGFNACGGCGDLPEGFTIDEPCDDACGVWTCAEDNNSGSCEGPEPNVCGGCVTLEGDIGDPCGECGQLACDPEAPDEFVCVDPGFNACGGCGELPIGFDEGQTCNDCGIWTCAEDNNSGFCDEPEVCPCGDIFCPDHPEGWPAVCNAQQWCEYAPEDEPLKAEIYLPAGTAFLMGSPADEPGRRPDGAEGGINGQPVNMSCGAFFIQKYPVTADAYAECEQAGECASRNANGLGQLTVSGNVPANGASRANAEEYCTYAGLRLLTEAEWELAANGPGDHRIHPWGDTPLANCGLATMDDDGNDQPGPGCGTDNVREVTAAPAGVSPVGVIDQCGNTLEWVAGCGGANLTNQPADCSARTQDCGNGTAYVLKGARFNARTDGVTNTLRTAYRGITSADFSDGGTGIRCARSAN